MIVIKGNEASEYYADYCIESWKKIGLDVKRFDAVTPETLKNVTGLSWNKYISSVKYDRANVKVEFTDTEKSCFYSHYMIWKKCIDKNEPVMVLEHDSYLETPENLWYDSNYGIIFYDKAATGSYIIFPWFAKMVVEYLKKTKIKAGPYATIDSFAKKQNMRDKVVTVMHKKYKAASNQVMSDVYGNTIEHYCNLYPELFNPKKYHKFIKI